MQDRIVPSGATRLVGLLGAKVEHSRSAEIHNRAFEERSLDWQYVGLQVRPERLDAALQGLAALGFRGANVTMPYKEAVLPLLDELSTEARAIGAVNTIQIGADGRLSGFNTDAQGFLEDLRDQGVSPSRPAHLLGAGGAARAVAYALAEAGCPEITVVNRTERRAKMLVDRFEPLFPSTRWKVRPWPRGVVTSEPAALVVNCTCVGMAGTDLKGESPWPSATPFDPRQVVYDLVYAPTWTPFLEHARVSGAQPISGLGMLVRQAALAFSIWTEVEAPLRVMELAVKGLWTEGAA
jgi:shikimate dehydrogenase